MKRQAPKKRDVKAAPARVRRNPHQRSDTARDLSRLPKSALAAEVSRLRASVNARDSQGRLMRELKAEYQALSTKNAELLNAQRELADLVDRYFDLYDFAPVGYLMLDQAGLIDQLNLAACRLFGEERTVLIGCPLVGRIVPEDRPVFRAHMLRCRKDEDAVESEVRLRTRRGEAIPVQISSRKAIVAETVAFRTVLVDLRERVRMEDERLLAERDEQRTRLSSEAKDRFLALLSHELRTPLTPALFAAAHLLDLRDMPSDGRHLVEVIRRSIEMEAELIDHLLDLTRIRTGKLALEMRHLDLDQVIRDVIEICRPQVEVRRQTITTDLRASNRQAVGDPSRLRQVFWNLLQNASKFSPPGESIEVKSEDIGVNRVRITVADRGPGLAPDEASRLFMPFESAARPAKRGMGLGLGLSICRGIVEGHGGEISGMSAGLGEGATFAVDLTATALQSFENVETPRPADRQPVLSGDQQEPLRILLVEDDRDSGDMLSALLAHLGHDVTLASSVREAAFHAGQSWDVVISDIGLPDGSGLEVGRFRESVRGQPLLIAMSGYGTSSDIGASRQAGFDEHLVKPFDFNLLLAALRRPALS